MKKNKLGFTDANEKKYQVIKLALLLEKKGLKTPFNIIKIYTNVKWRFYQTTNFNKIPSSNQSKLDYIDFKSKQTISKQSLRIKVQEVQIKSQTERIHQSLQDDMSNQSRLHKFSEIARFNQKIRQNLNQKMVIKKDVFEKIYEFGLLATFLGFLISFYLVITQQI
ncbi:unnamed protein product [Paramecium sonneborni]|uniref:Transmembrane protein n=1 Tax=Paramecium sonneborni TaxID=65129 RepID=A0A8S1R9P6_9CILI|nr:unnamed protein product [Paramecium sonneborni]